MRIVEIEAFAKINIGLTVFGKQPSGYHDIESIFQNVDISDVLKIRQSKRLGIAVHGELGCPVETSTVYKAVEAFRSARPNVFARTGIEIQVEKNIPSGAGLGGAGADAAATLLGLDLLYETKLSRGDLARMAESIASDVPFFIHGGAAVVRGRGEYIEPIQPREDFGLIVVQPTWDSKTPEAYAELDALRERGVLRELPIARPLGDRWCVSKTTAELAAEYESSIGAWAFRNDFEPVLKKKHSDYALLYETMRLCGAHFISMSGSGSCFYGIFPSRRDAIEAAAHFEELFKLQTKRALIPIAGIFATQPLARSIKVRYIQDCSEDTRSDEERPCYGSD